MVQASKLYHINLVVFNKFHGPVDIKFSDNIPPDGFRLQSNIIAKIKKNTSNPKALSVHAQDSLSRKTLYVNNLPKIRVTPTKFDVEDISVVISDKSNIKGMKISCKFRHSEITSSELIVYTMFVLALK